MPPTPPTVEQLEERIRHERELREMATRMADATLQRQAMEYERRLSELNHAHAQNQDERSTFVKQELYEQTQRDLAAWKLQVTTDMTVAAERLKADQDATARTLAKNQWLVSMMLGLLMVGLSVANFLIARF